MYIYVHVTYKNFHYTGQYLYSILFYSILFYSISTDCGQNHNFDADDDTISIT